MIRYFYMAFKLIMKRKILSLLVILAIIVSSAYLFPMLSEYIYFSNAKAAVEKIGTDNVYYIFSFFPYKNDAYLYDAFYKKIENSDYIDSVGEVFVLFDSEDKYNLLVYNENIIKNYSPILSDGRWFDEHENTDTAYIPVVVAQGTGFDIGESFNMIIEIYHIYDLVTLPVECRVIGIIDTPTQYLSLSGGAAEGYFKLDSLLGNEQNAILLPLSPQISALLESYYYSYTIGGKLIYTNRDVEFDEISKDIGYYGEITNMNNGKGYFYTYMNTVAMDIGYYFSIYALLSIITLIVLNVIQNISNRKNFAIYYLIGMSQKQGAIIEFIRILILMLFSMVGIVAYNIYSGNMSLNFEPGQYSSAFGISFMYVAIVFIPVALSFFINSMRYNIVDAINNLLFDH